MLVDAQLCPKDVKLPIYIPLALSAKVAHRHIARHLATPRTSRRVSAHPRRPRRTTPPQPVQLNFKNNGRSAPLRVAL